MWSKMKEHKGGCCCCCWDGRRRGRGRGRSLELWVSCYGEREAGTREGFIATAAGRRKAERHHHHLPKRSENGPIVGDQTNTVPKAGRDREAHARARTLLCPSRVPGSRVRARGTHTARAMRCGRCANKSELSALLTASVEARTIGRPWRKQRTGLLPYARMKGISIVGGVHKLGPGLPNNDCQSRSRHPTPSRQAPSPSRRPRPFPRAHNGGARRSPDSFLFQRRAPKN
ncbi:hypothetical protein PYCCODRAFT_691300 [Trametes coccinea BRFM310]|uniref:Uncharacterized protein n=1 Tax=Trametes coccinea (strain BRFM310) TaxID=1353009 RepID=A0A1Y2IHD8_TRAC3|nr:hypothetical protein PYCCODRAFT_691300 [Trametes coccinea BRFM310]